MGPDYGAQLVIAVQAGVRDELAYIVLVGALRFRVSDVGEPFFLGRYIGEPLEL